MFQEEILALWAEFILLLIINKCSVYIYTSVQEILHNVDLQWVSCTRFKQDPQMELLKEEGRLQGLTALGRGDHIR